MVLAALVVVAAVLVTTGVITLGGGEGRIEGSGSGSADAAVKAYLGAMKASDVDAMVKAFAVETYGEHADAGAFMKRSNAWQPNADPLLPGHGLNAALNARIHLGRISGAIVGQYLALSDPTFDPTLATAPCDDACVGEFSDRFKGDAFRNVSSAQIIDWESRFPDLASTYHSEQNQSNIERQYAYLDADELADRVAEVHTPTGTFYLFFQVIRYGDTWWLGAPSGNLGSLAGAPAAGILAADQIG